MIPVIYLNGFLSKRRIQHALAELEDCAHILAKQPPGTKREMTIVIYTEPEDTGDVLACWAFAERMMQLSTLHGIKTYAKVYASSFNTTLIAMATDYREIKRDSSCLLNLGMAHFEVSDITLSHGIRPDVIAELRRCRMGIQALIRRKARKLSSVVAFQMGESVCLGTTVVETKEAVDSFFS